MTALVLVIGQFLAGAAAPAHLGEALTRDTWGRHAFEQSDWRPHLLDLTPARWVWMPSTRTLSNTFVLFRREIVLDTVPVRARGFISADSRYRLTVNGKRVQWGPAPCDPRHLDADPVDIAPLLLPGKNVLGVEVLHYGLGDGTWPAGKPGMLFHLVLEFPDGTTRSVVSDGDWRCMIDRAHPPGQHKRWFLRALQEEYDARLHPEGWDTPGYAPGEEWCPAMPLECPPDKPAACSDYDGNDLLDRVREEDASLRVREIPLITEPLVSAKGLAESGRILWHRDPRDWFDMRVPGAYTVDETPGAETAGDKTVLPATGDREGVYATFEFNEHIVGWPQFTIDAPEGAVVELMVQESHAPDGPAWLDTDFYAWTRFICREGVNAFEPFDYESFRWMQLHVRNANRPVTVSAVGARRRLFPWPNPARVKCSDPALQRLFDATVNTLNNSAQDVAVDGMGRERQQYSGDGSPQLFAIRQTFGETRLPRRFLRTFSEGQSPEGYFMDCWPAFDRLARVQQKQIQGAYWGPLLDHGVGFVFDCWNHYLETGDRDGVAEAYPRLLRFADYLAALRGGDGLLPVEGLGIPTVWMDHLAFKKPSHKQCAFNLYAAAMYTRALAPLAQAFGDNERSEQCLRTGAELLAAATKRFWDAERGLFVDNLPFLAEEGAVRLSDRTLAMSILFVQSPGGVADAALRALVECPPEMGLSYPANAHWRYWALARRGRADVVVSEFRSKWATMGSVLLNNTLQEMWEAPADSTAEWSHCPVVPLYFLHMDIAGIRATSPGFATCDVRPQLGDIGDLEVVTHTVLGPFELKAEADGGGHEVTLAVPKGCDATLVLPEGTSCSLPPAEGAQRFGFSCYRLRAGEKNVFRVPK